MRDQSKLYEELWEWVRAREGEHFSAAEACAGLPHHTPTAVRLMIERFLEQQRLIVSLRSDLYGHRYREPTAPGKWAPRKPWDRHPINPQPLFQAWTRIARLPFLGARGEQRHTGQVVRGAPGTEAPSEPQEPGKEDFRVLDRLLALAAGFCH